MTRYLAMVALAASIAMILAVTANAHDWYDGDCCNVDDCRPISGVDAQGRAWSEVDQTADGYVWTSAQTGQVYKFRETDRMTTGAPRIRPSRDGFYHGCESRYGPPASLCLYVPSMF